LGVIIEEMQYVLPLIFILLVVVVIIDDTTDVHTCWYRSHNHADV